MSRSQSRCASFAFTAPDTYSANRSSRATYSSSVICPVVAGGPVAACPALAIASNDTVSVHVDCGVVPSAPGAPMQTTLLPASCATFQRRGTDVGRANPDRRSPPRSSPGTPTPVMPCADGHAPLKSVGWLTGVDEIAAGVMLFATAPRFVIRAKAPP